MTATQTATRTDEVLAEMLTENTGRHMLDSGGAYGRSWERNQGKTVETYLAEPRAWFDGWGVTLSVFHWLRERLEYDAELDAKLQDFASREDRSGCSYLQDAEDFAVEVLGVSEHDLRTVNTYNGEDCLSQTLQWVSLGDLYESAWGEDGEDYGDVVLLQIHGGCDVRGGYTAPRAFRQTAEHLYDNADFSLYCDADPEPQAEHLPGMDGWQYAVERHYVDMRSGEATDRTGCFVRTDDLWEGGEWITEDAEGDKYIPCPYDGCGRPMSVDAPYAY